MQGGNDTAARPFMRMPRALRAALFYLIQWTWGLPQNLLGLIIMLLLGRQERRRYHGAAATLFGSTRIVPQSGAFSLGMFIFIPKAWGEEHIAKTMVHEYGHTLQSMILGPLYLPAVALPSVIWGQVWYSGRLRAKRTLEKAMEAPALPGAEKRIRACSPQKIVRLQKRANLRYTARYPENWANTLGEYATGEAPADN